MTEHTLESSVVVDLEGNLERQAKRYESAIQNMSRQGSRHMSVLQRTTRSLDSAMTRMGNRWVALATGGTLVAAGRQVVKLDERVERLGIQANISSERIRKLQDDIMSAANAAEARVDNLELLSAIEEIVEKTGDIEFARQNLDNLAMTLSATGAEGKAIGGIAAEFQKMGIVDTKDVREALDILITQGKEGAFTLQNLAALGPRVVTAYTAMGRTGVPAIRELGAALQVIRMSTGSSEQAATSFEALMRVLSKADKIKALQAGGIQVFDPEQLKRGKEVLRPINELIVDIVKAAKGRKTVLDQVIGDSEALRSFNTAITEFNATGEVASLERFYGVVADGTALLDDSKRAAQTAAGASRLFLNAWQDFADQELSQPITDMANALSDVDGAELLETLGDIKDAALAIGVIFAGYKVLKVGKAIADASGSVLRGASGSKGGGLGSLQPIPVYVVNGPGLLGGDAASKGSKAAKVGKLGRLGAGAMLLGGSATAVVGAGALGYGAGTLLNKGIEGTSAHNELGKIIASALAALGVDSAQEAVAADYSQNPRARRRRRGGPADDETAVKVEIALTNEASKALKPKNIESNGVDVAVSGSMTTM